jgi:hypothetical protein
VLPQPAAVKPARRGPLQRIRNSAAYRSSALYRRALELLPSPRGMEKPPLPFTFLTFGGASHRLMLRECIVSLHRAWPSLPALRVVSDGSLDRARTARDLRWWRGPREVLDWRDLTAHLTSPAFDALVRFAERDAMGRKMAAVVASALEAPTLYCDVDVLWFRFPATLETLLAEEGPKLILSPDCRPMYDPALVPAKLPHLACPPFYCAGLLFAQGDFLAACDVGELLAYAAEHGIGVTEQTILAEASRQLGGGTWPAEEIFLWEEDRFSLGPSFRGRSWAARHYVGAVRHIFWRDSLALRAGLAP